MTLPDGLYVVDYKQIYAGFVIEDGRVVTRVIEDGRVVACAPILEKLLFSFWMKIARRFHE